MARLVAKFGQAASGGGLWLFGTATCETYLRCQVCHPSMENDWDLQAVPITTRAPLPAIFPREVNNVADLCAGEALRCRDEWRFYEKALMGVSLLVAVDMRDVTSSKKGNTQQSMLKKEKQGKRGRDGLDQFFSECEMTKPKVFQSLCDEGLMCPMLGKHALSIVEANWINANELNVKKGNHERNYNKNKEDTHTEGQHPVEASVEWGEKNLKRGEKKLVLGKENLALREDVLKLKSEVEEAHNIGKMRKLELEAYRLKYVELKSQVLDVMRGATKIQGMEDKIANLQAIIHRSTSERTQSVEQPETRNL
ncbi:protein SUPPRESSOR OF MAX2 1 [Senna tora]|uniref:Protein SUPPRESSOR OF MAX2 1 n=1 Tax=Senna tora TaxID=362788 RepID=A0A834T2A8_9FABA|nr:protein SUPPRESSOR OF MAX2 1 [Senna tora]